MKHLLITGGAGFIGINSARHFLSKGWTVTILDNFSRAGTETNLLHLQKDYRKGVKVVRADIVTDLATVAKEAAKADVVLHLAAQVAVTTSITDPRNDFMINALGTFNVLEAVRKAKTQPVLLFSSTNKVYGSLEHLTVRATASRYQFRNAEVEKYGVSENEPLDFHSPYGCSKGSADQYVIDYSRIYGIKTVVFRQSCIYGEHQFGIEDQGWIAWFAIAARTGKPITIYGTGKQVRDVLYVGDLVSLYEKAIENIDRVSGKAYNIGGGPKNTVSLKEFTALLDTTIGKKIAYARADERAGDQPIFVADVRRIKKDLGWAPTTSFNQGFTRLYSWIDAHDDLFPKR